MNIKLTAGAIIGLVIVIAFIIIVFYILLIGKKKQPSKKQPSKKQNDTSLEALKAIIKKKTSSAEQLSKALDLVIKYHGDISQQAVGKKNTSFDAYIDILFTICRHPNTNKNIIINFDYALSKKNPTYKTSINNIITKGLKSR